MSATTETEGMMRLYLTRAEALGLAAKIKREYEALAEARKAMPAGPEREKNRLRLVLAAISLSGFCAMLGPSAENPGFVMEVEGGAELKQN